MIPRFNFFSIFKAKPNENIKLPTHSISMKIGEEYVTIGGCWTKESTNGKFLSGKLADAWVNSNDNSKSRDGFCIVRTSDLDKLENGIKEELEDHTAIDPATNQDLNSGESPF